MNNPNINWFDAVLVVSLIAGLIHGRKKGVSHEFMPMLQWLLVAGLGGYFHRDLARFIAPYTGLSDMANAYLCYIFIFMAIVIIISKPKRAIGEKFLEKDVFGSMEYYFGMIAGMIAATALVIIVAALLHGRVITDQQLAEKERKQKEIFGQSFFPTMGKIQRDVFQLFTGTLIKDHLQPFLVQPASAAKPKPGKPVEKDTLKSRREKEMEEIIKRPGK